MKLAIIGASYLQVPLISRAKEMGHETFVFAWAAGDPGERIANHFIPLSIVEKDAILARCREIGIDGICTIASDLAAVTVGYVADAIGLPGNPPDCVRVSTNKHLMRLAFEKNGDPSPRSLMVSSPEEALEKELHYPVIVKPLDRSGSRGITRLESPEGLREAVAQAMDQGFEKKALIEEFAEGREYSVEGISWQGKHRILTITEKYTTGSPGFIERGHLEPAGLDEGTALRVHEVVTHALDSLGVQNGASHSEVKIDQNGNIRIIEIGARMGGDLIGSHLVPLTTGYDYVGDVIRCALGQEPEAFRGIRSKGKTRYAVNVEESSKNAKPQGESDGLAYPAAAVRFIFDENDLDMLARLKGEHPEYLAEEDVHPLTEAQVSDSSTRFGYFLMVGPSREDLLPWMPEEK